MAKEKKLLTVKQKQTKYRALQYVTLGGEYVAITAPFAVMSIVNREEWFNVKSGWRTAIGFTLACLLFTIIVTSITFESEKLNNRKGKYIKLLIGCVIAALIFIFLRDIMNEIANILWYAALGIACALGLDISSADFKAKADMYKGVLREAKEERVKEQAKEEIKNGDVRF